VTVGGVRYALERPLFVLATENPIEQEGTHPLPEAQLDRFMFNVVIDYPAVDEERKILAQTPAAEPPPITPVATGADLERMRTLVRDLPAAENVIECAMRIARRRGRAMKRAAGRAAVGEVGRRSPRGSGAAARRQGARSWAAAACRRSTT
jgi:MoxR-like ATPase